ncbi:MAG TPA: ankyrin repeat domain-containing protein [Chitinophagales bacterium]|nr:ankyrin repeat domain-containing protein [Chitinophagales bacterium]
MRVVVLFLVSSLSWVSCSTKEGLNAGSYGLFEKTPAWDLAKAVGDKDEEAIRRLVAQNPQLINYQEGKYGNTLLMLTILNRQMEAFSILLSLKADINIHNTSTGASALILAAKYQADNTEFVEALLKNGANVNDIEVGKRRESNGTRLTPLIAAVTGSLDFVELLVENGADINYQNEFKQSALSQAVLLGKRQIALYLLKHGADYTQPIFNRPEENRDIFLIEVLREDFVDLDSEDHIQKMEIVKFLGTKNIDYWSTPIPEYIKKKAQEEYPSNWEEYLKKY